MCDEEETVERSTEYLHGVRDCARYVIDQLASELWRPDEPVSPTIKAVDDLLTDVEEILKYRFRQDFNADIVVSKPKAKSVVSEKPAPTEA